MHICESVLPAELLWKASHAKQGEGWWDIVWLLGLALLIII